MNGTWQESNQLSLTRELDQIYTTITRVSGGESPPAVRTPAGGSREPPVSPSPPPALERLTSVLGLTPFERDVLLLCAGIELESRFAAVCAGAHQDPRLVWPTFSLALAALPDPHWSAISRDRPLRYWRLVDVGSGESLLRSPLRIDERILHYLAGVSCLDERLEPFVRPLPLATGSVPATIARSAAVAARCWTGSLHDPDGLKPVVLIGRRSADQQIVAQEMCRIVGLRPFVMRAADVPVQAAEREQLARLWNREALLAGAALYIQTAGADGPDAGRPLSAFLAHLRAPVALEVQDGSPLDQCEGFRIHVGTMARPEREAMWMESLGALADHIDGSLDRVVDHFNFDAASIRLAGAMAREAAAGQAEADLPRVTWQVCRLHARRSLESLAQRIEPKAAWRDLVLPDLQVDTLRQIVAQVRQRSIVHDRWGFADRYPRGSGVTALFTGTSGTGKTMAAEVLAAELDLDLYQIDLSAVVSKYIGETEKNLRRVFDAAEDSGAVLLFDEADALFGKRSEVRDSHDRYANIEISYLLQRMESYSGLAVLTTNMKHALDPAFLRRIRFIVQFSFPDTAQRRRIWERVFPAQTPVTALDFTRLAQLNVPGGIIRNIATHAAFLAADEGAAVGMGHILRACRVEYAKLDKPLTPSEVGGWT